MGEISIWVAPESDAVGMGVLKRGSDAVLEKLDPEKLNASLKALAQDLEAVLVGVETKGGFQLKGVEVGIEVTAEAGVNLIGTAKVLV
jgi:hypothetical protein